MNIADFAKIRGLSGTFSLDDGKLKIEVSGKTIKAKFEIESDDAGLRGALYSMFNNVSYIFAPPVPMVAIDDDDDDDDDDEGGGGEDLEVPPIRRQ